MSFFSKASIHLCSNCFEFIHYLNSSSENASVKTLAYIGRSHHTLTVILFSDVTCQTGDVHCGDDRLKNIDLKLHRLGNKSRKDAGQSITVPRLAEARVSSRIYNDLAAGFADQDTVAF